MIFFPWYPALMLEVESNNVIDIRIRKAAASSPNEAIAEIGLMISEKIASAAHTVAILSFGGSGADVVKHYRGDVALNTKRLAPAMTEI